MTTYDNLPVYKASYDLLVEIFRFVKTFSREYKYTLGESIKKETIELISLIYKANSDFSKRKECLTLARQSLELIRLYLRLTKDLNQISLKTFVLLSTIIESVSKQLFSWQKSL
jgi:uncharacterized protein YpuA (DUF1002 family)